MKASVLKGLLKYGVGLGLLGWVVARNWRPVNADGSPKPGLADVFDGTSPAHLTPLLVAGLLLVVSVALTFVRWHWLVRAQDLPFSLYNACRLGLIGLFFNTFMPGSVGGDIVKAYAISKEHDRRTVAVSTVLIDRGVGLWALAWLVALLGCGFWLAGNPVVAESAVLQRLIKGAVAVVAVSMAVWVLLGFLPERRAQRFAGRLRWLPKVGGPLAELWGAVWMYRKRGRAVFAALALALVSHTGFVLAFHNASRVLYDAAKADKPLPTLTEHFLIVPVGLTVQALAPTPGGAGFGELGFAGLYYLTDHSPNDGEKGSLSQRLLTLLLGAAGGLVYLWMKRRHDLPETETADDPPAAVPAVAAAKP